MFRVILKPSCHIAGGEVHLRHRRQSPVTSGGTTDSDGWESTRLFPLETKIPVPPIELQNQVGPPGVFHDVGLTTMGRLNMAGLRPEHDVLDIGCGVGRTARYLCDYLEASSRYDGFDVKEQLIAWCHQNITPAFPNFRFTCVPVYSGSYLPDPSLPSASDLTFPYEDDAFDFVFAHSVFTHLGPASVPNYLREIRRVLRPGGTSYTTWLLFAREPSESPTPIVAGMTLDSSGDFAVHDPSVVETAIGYRESYVRRLYQESGLTITQPIRSGYKKLQDAIIASG
jgi:SAM-dependent methyltransferase